VPLIALASVKASPGVTTTALALAAVWPAPRRLVIEADPSGGDLGAWLGLAPAPGLASLAAAIRHDASPGAAWRHAQVLPGGGVSVVVAPAGAEQAAACLATLAAPRAGTAWLDPGSGEAVVIADCGRLDPHSAAFAVAARAAVTLVLVRPRVSELSHLAERLPGLARAGLRPALLLAPAGEGGTGEACYPPGEITATLGVPVEGSLPADPRTVAALIRGRGVLAPSRRLPLAQAVSGLAAALAARLIPPVPSPAVPAAPVRRVPAHPVEVTSRDPVG
jgi:MinD-like ATPase involved in chromosome partitioning or flagellar assembly